MTPARYDQHIDPALTFHVVTCMMGTFEHIAHADQERLIERIYGQARRRRCGHHLRVGRRMLPPFAYLSIYGEGQKELIRQNSRTRSQMSALFRRAGFRDALVVPFCLLPQTVIYDLGIERMSADDIDIAAQADLVARALFNDRHGEMFLAIGYK